MKTVLAIALFVTLVAVVSSDNCNTTDDCMESHITHCSHNTVIHCDNGSCGCITKLDDPCTTNADCSCVGQHVHAHCVHGFCHCSGH